MPYLLKISELIGNCTSKIVVVEAYVLELC